MNIIDLMYKFYDKSNLKKGFIGETESGKKIPYFFVGNHGKKIILAQYSIHAREYITSYLALRQMEYLSNYNLDFGVYFIPMVNIDGVDLCVNGLKNIFTEKREFLLKINNGEDFSKFKANINGVDLNVNFDANFGKGKFNINYPASENYIGKYAFSEKESVALKNFTLKVRPNISLSYHSKGEEIYYEFGQKGTRMLRDYILGKRIEKLTGYKLKKTIGSCGGYKDWCIQKLNIPSYTIEVGSDNLSHPIGEEYLKDIFEKNKNVFFALTKST